MTARYLIFNGEINERTTNLLMSAVTGAINDKDVESIYLGMTSGGGQVNPGVGAHHFLKASPKPITVHAIGPINSIALSIFMGVKKRYAAPGSSFQFHGVGRNLGAGNYTSPVLRDMLSLITGDEAVLKGIWQSHMKLNDAEASAFFQGEHVHDCQWAIDRGLIEEVRDFVIPHTAIGNIVNVI